MFEIFKNGSAKVNRRLMLIELALSSLMMCIVTIQGYIPSQDWIPASVLKPLAFGLAVVAILLKGSEMFFSKAASIYSQDKDNETNNKNKGNTDMINKSTLTGLLMAGVLLFTASSQAQTNGVGSFFGTVQQYFTTFNPNLTNTFNGKASLWTGVDSLSGNKASIANEIGVSYNVYGILDVESVTRDGGVSGTLVSQAVGLNANFKLLDTRLTVYADAGYVLDGPAGSKFGDNLFGEVGLRVSKALSEHTYAWVGLGAQFPTQARVFSGGVGFTF